MDNDLRFVLPKAKDDEEIPEPGTPGNEWLGVERFVNGAKQFYAFSSAEIARMRRRTARFEAAEKRRGQRAYNRSQRRQARLADTRRMQLLILQGEVEVPEAMRRNLVTSLENQQRAEGRAENAAGDREMAAAVRESRAEQRRIRRFQAGQPRGKDLREDVFARYAHMIPEGPFRARAERVMAAGR